MKWITREKPKIDRLACPWLIQKFIDKDAEFIYVPFEEVLIKAVEFDAIPFDIPNVEYTHYGTDCTFDYIIKKHKINDPAIKIIANIVRGADTDKHEIAQESAGLWAISMGLSHNYHDDSELLKVGFVLYDALYSWATHHHHENHLKNSPFESLLHEVYSTILSKAEKKTPKWVKDLKELIQDQIDTQYIFNLKEVSETINVNPSYLSREFGKHFDDLSFGDYIRKMRIDQAKKLIEESKYTLTEIAYLTGFSDQAHFSRVFKKVTAISPLQFKKNLHKSK